jgi:hypothetical protein
MKNLWGRDFALVPDGLSEGDVTAFVEEIISRHKDPEERLEHIDSLHRLATDTLREAQELAELHKSEGRKKADDEAQVVITDATERARTIIEFAETQARELRQEAKTDSEREAASAMLVAEIKAKELIVSAQASAQRRINDAQDFPSTQPVAASPQSGGLTQGQTTPTPNSGPKTQHTFRWNAVPGATRYGLYLCSPPYGKEDFVYVKEDLTETSLILPIDLEPSVIYKWTIRAGNAKGWGKPNPFKEYPA